MKVVNLYDLKQMGNKGGCTIQLIHHFPFGMGLGHLKKDYIEFKRWESSRSYSSRTLFERSTAGCQVD